MGDKGDSTSDPTLDCRSLTTREREILQLLLSADFPGVEQLRQQSEFTRADPWTCGCGSINLVVDQLAAPRSPSLGRMMVEAESKEREAKQGVFDLILWVDDGWLRGIELVDYSYVDRHKTDGPHVLPSPADFKPPTTSAS